jgi:hypothetical protein
MGAAEAAADGALRESVGAPRRVRSSPKTIVDHEPPWGKRRATLAARSLGAPALHFDCSAPDP